MSVVVASWLLTIIIISSSSSGSRMVQHGLYMPSTIFLNPVQKNLARTANIVPSAIRPCDFDNGDGVGDDNGDHGDGNSDGATSRGLNRAGPQHFARALCMCRRVLRIKHILKRNSLMQNLFFAFRR